MCYNVIVMSGVNRETFCILPTFLGYVKLVARVDVPQTQKSQGTGVSPGGFSEVFIGCSQEAV